MQLDRAYLCLDCDDVGENSVRCNKCLSEAIFPIHLWLNKTLTLESFEIGELERMHKL